MRGFAAALTSLIVVLNQFASPAWAWGRTGHRVIAKLAERHLTEPAKAEIKALLERGESLADASTWADEVRGRMRHTAPWHYVDVPLDEPRYDDRFAGDTPEKGFIVPKIREVRVVLKDRSRQIKKRCSPTCLDRSLASFTSPGDPTATSHHRTVWRHLAIANGDQRDGASGCRSRFH